MKISRSITDRTSIHELFTIDNDDDNNNSNNNNNNKSWFLIVHD